MTIKRRASSDEPWWCLLISSMKNAEPKAVVRH